MLAPGWLIRLPGSKSSHWASGSSGLLDGGKASKQSRAQTFGVMAEQPNSLWLRPPDQRVGAYPALSAQPKVGGPGSTLLHQVPAQGPRSDG